MKEKWEVKKLGEVFALQYGKPLPKNKRSDYGKYPVYGANGIKTYSNEFYKEGPSLIIGRKGTAGAINKAVQDFWPLDVTYYLEFRSKNQSLDFYYYLLSFLELEKLATGVKPGINRNNVYSIKVSIPPLSEQKRIVRIIEETFKSIDQTLENTRNNLEDAKKVFDSYLDDIFSVARADWIETEMDSIYDVRDGTHDSPKYEKSGYPLITSKNLKNGKITFDKVKYISKMDYDHINKRSKVEIGDVLFAMIGTIGNPVVITKKPNYAIKNVALFKVPEGQNSMFLYYYLRSSNVKLKMNREARGTTQRFVGLGYLRNFKTIIPNYKVQCELVKKINDVEIDCKKLQNIYQQKLDNLEELKKSILEKAFNGEL